MKPGNREYHARQSLRGAAVAFLLTAIVARGHTQAAEFRVLALSGDPPSGTVTTDQFQRFDAPPTINNRGEVAFLAGPHAKTNQQFPGATSVWLADPAELHLLASNGSGPAQRGPGSPPFASFSDLVLNDASTVAFAAALDPGGGMPSPTGIWQASRDGLRRMAQSGTEAPGFDERPFESFFPRPALAADGSMAFYGVVRPTLPQGSYEGGLWSSPNGVPSLAACASAAPLAEEPTATFAAQSFGSPFSDRAVVTSGGTTVFTAFLEGPSISPENGMGVWSFDPAEGLEMIVRAGDVAPGDGRDWVSFPEPPAVNDRGDVTFLAFVRDESDRAPAAAVQGELGVSIGIWTARDGVLAPRLRVGDPAPGLAKEATFLDFDRPLANGRSRVAVMAAVDGLGVDEANAIGIWSDGLDPHGEMRLVAQGGMRAPGTTQEVVFHSFLEPTLNNSGQVAFMAGVAGPDVSDANGNVLGLWGQDRAGRLRLVARTGDRLDVGRGDVRQIAAIVFASGSGGQDGWPRGLNDSGQVTFRVRFSDGTSAVLLSDALTVPEPSARLIATFMLLSTLLWFASKLPSYAGAGWIARPTAAGLFAIVATSASLGVAAEPDYLYPDLIPFVREDQPYLQNWVIQGDELRIETVFANVGDGLFQIRVDRSTASGGSIDVFQRVFVGTDNGRDYEDFPANRSVFHPGHGHLHLEDFSEFQLRAVTVGKDGLLGVGGLVANNVKTSFLIHDGLRLPDPQWADAPSYPSFNLGTYQNISVGHADVYSHSTLGQAIDIAGVERGPLYWLRQTVDPTDVLLETDATNNSFEILIDLNDQSTAKMHANGRFVRPGDFYPILPGDLDLDQRVTLADWSLFREGVGSDLTDLSDAESYLLGDLNLDGRHTPADFLLFRQAYEDFNSPRAAAALGPLPEPSALTIALTLLAARLAYSLGCSKGIHRPNRGSSQLGK